MEKWQLKVVDELANTRIDLDINNWLWLDFKAKIAYYGSITEYAGYEPASIWTTEAFRKYYLKHGKLECSFANLKCYSNFNGCKKKGVVYAVVPITNVEIFKYLLDIKNNRAECDMLLNHNPSLSELFEEMYWHTVKVCSEGKEIKFSTNEDEVIDLFCKKLKILLKKSKDVK